MKKYYEGCLVWIAKTLGIFGEWREKYELHKKYPTLKSLVEGGGNELKKINEKYEEVKNFKQKTYLT